ncbi:(4Fe-4S)-binding protein [Desulfuromonas versatilis]|uniref:(4Fe-4S)-binding protein n=1 Tax=Desulfuromonas versatilis TaxID=2802975 RepID=A0ABN6DVS2_9BACT|nr:DUF362 domain-containing protein [Desulfuromonas versatilis]BCR04216.1 (4Fe-4S)-binding protein [Desulfuromonas versatilis]
MKHPVSLVAAPDYSPQTITAAIERLLAPLGGMQAFVRPGQKVLLKPNLLSAKPPEKAVTTHPEVVRAVIALVQGCGGIVSVGDSPGIGTPRQVAQRCGILQVIEESGARFAPFADSVKVRPQGSTFHELEVARDILEADVVINLPKLKTHQMIGLTCAVKNLFGAVVGMRKPRLHLQAGTDKAFFALMLLELAEHIRPALNIVDAVVGMEGQGPGGGDPVQIGALLAGADALAVDTLAMELVGLRPDACWTQKIARKTGRPGSRLEELEIYGERPAALRPAHFRPAKATDVNFGLPPFLKNPLKRTTTALPEPDFEKCLACGLCVQHCPPRAMTVETGRLQIDLERCIGCFCCQELCPHGAILTRQGLLLRLSRFLRGS